MGGSAPLISLRSRGSKRLQVDARSAEFPTRTGIRNALDELARLGLAARGSEQGAYIVAFMPPKGDVFDWFVKLLAKKSGRKLDGTAPGQLPLFPEEYNAGPE